MWVSVCVCVCVYGICNNVCVARFRLKIMLCLPTVSTKSNSDSATKQKCNFWPTMTTNKTKSCQKLFSKRSGKPVSVWLRVCVSPCNGNMCQLMAVIVVMSYTIIMGANLTIRETRPTHNNLLLLTFLFRSNQFFWFRFSLLFFLLAHFLLVVLQVEVYFVNMPLKVFHFPLKYSNQMPTPATMCLARSLFLSLPLCLFHSVSSLPRLLWCVCMCILVNLKSFSVASAAADSVSCFLVFSICIFFVFVFLFDLQQSENW